MRWTLRSVVLLRIGGTLSAALLDSAMLHQVLVEFLRVTGGQLLQLDLRACLKSFDKRRREADNREKQAGVGGNASISK